jgi:hypothetical protein
MARNRTKKAKAHADGTTNRSEDPAFEGREPLPEEITGRASGTGDSLTSLFDNPSGAHLTDGFQGGSGDVAEGTDETADPDAIDDADGVTPRRPKEPEGTRD